MNKSQKILPLPTLNALRKLGSDINEARRRRRISIQLLAERANLSRVTVGKIEKGDPGTSIGAYVSILFVLGLVDRVNDLADASHDKTGLQLAEEALPKKIRPYKKGQIKHEKPDEQ